MMKEKRLHEGARDVDDRKEGSEKVVGKEPCPSHRGRCNHLDER